MWDGKTGTGSAIYTRRRSVSHTSKMLTATANAVMGSMNAVMDVSPAHLSNPAFRSGDQGDGMTLLAVTGHLRPPMLGRTQQTPALPNSEHSAGDCFLTNNLEKLVGKRGFFSDLPPRGYHFTGFNPPAPVRISTTLTRAFSGTAVSPR